MDIFELIEKLRDVDEVTLVELLDLKSTDIVDAFTDKIYERISYLLKELEE